MMLIPDDEVTVDASLVRELLEAQFPQWADLRFFLRIENRNISVTCASPTLA
jgi:hypothetical protein